MQIIMKYMIWRRKRKAGEKNDYEIVSIKIMRRGGFWKADCGFEFIAVGTQNFASLFELIKTSIGTEVWGLRFIMKMNSQSGIWVDGEIQYFSGINCFFFNFYPGG